MTNPLLIMGATSGIGSLAMHEAVKRGIAVRAFARSAADLDFSDLVTPQSGDARSAEDVTTATKDVQAVIYALGIKERLSMLWQEEKLFSESTRFLLAAMKANDVERLVVVTGFGAGRSKAALSSVERLGLKMIFGKPYADKDRQEAMIIKSDLKWTIVRPVILTNGATSHQTQVLREPSTWHNGLVPRCDVARYLVDAATSDLDVNIDVVISR